MQNTSLQIEDLVYRRIEWPVDLGVHPDTDSSLDSAILSTIYIARAVIGRYVQLIDPRGGDTMSTTGRDRRVEVAPASVIEPFVVPGIIEYRPPATQS